MKRSRALHHLEDLALRCADMAGRPTTIFPLRVTSLWTFAEVLTGLDDLDHLSVVLTVDLAIDDVPWLCPPAGAEHWSNAVGLSKSPVTAVWRSTRAPVWNHVICRPLLIWDETGGVAAGALSALRDGTAEGFRQPEPTSGDLAARLAAELSVSLQALRANSATYEERRFRPGKLEPIADALWSASTGYLDVLAAC